MNISGALKEKNKKVKKVQTHLARLSKFNSIVEGTEQTYDPKESYEKLMKEIDSLVELKTQIHITNQPIYQKIFRLSELKSLVNGLKRVGTKNGKEISKDRFREEVTEMNHIAHFDTKTMDKMIEDFEKEIETIQEELDHHNHTTNLKK